MKRIVLFFGVALLLWGLAPSADAGDVVIGFGTDIMPFYENEYPDQPTLPELNPQPYAPYGLTFTVGPAGGEGFVPYCEDLPWKGLIGTNDPMIVALDGVTGGPMPLKTSGFAVQFVDPATGGPAVAFDIFFDIAVGVGTVTEEVMTLRAWDLDGNIAEKEIDQPEHGTWITVDVYAMIPDGFGPVSSMMLCMLAGDNTPENPWVDGFLGIDNFRFSGDAFPDYIEPPADSDGDGIPNEDDACPCSYMDETVVIDGCDSGVENIWFDDGCTITDLVMDCAVGARNHGQFVRCVSHVTNYLKKAGIISGKEKGAIQRCAARSNLP